MPPELVVDGHFPSGNIVVDRIDGDDIFLHQDLRDTYRDWFYWSFRVEGGSGRHLMFHFTQSDVIGARGPAVSLDQGATWFWHDHDVFDSRNFSFDVPHG